MDLQHLVVCEGYAWEDGGSLGGEKVLHAVVQAICSPLPGSNRRPFGYKPNALPLSQGGSFECLNSRVIKIRILELGHMKDPVIM